MALEIMRDPRVRAVEWKDLVPVTTFEIIKELTLVFPWLIGSLILASYGHYILAFSLSFVLFLTGLALSHHAPPLPPTLRDGTFAQGDRVGALRPERHHARLHARRSGDASPPPSALPGR